MTMRVLDRYWCVYGEVKKWGWRNSLIVFANFLLLVAAGLILSGCAGVTSAKVNSTTITNTNATPAGLPGTGAPVAPSIDTEPRNQAILIGQTATFAVIASGTAPLSYQWLKNSIPINGASSASYTTPPTSSSDTGAQFTVVVSNSAGSITSSVASLSVTSVPVAPSITSQPANQTIVAGQPATFSVSVSGTAPLGFQWYKNGAAISGATSPNFTTPTETSVDSGSQFSVVVSNSVGSVTSNAATLTVNSAPLAPSITTQPVSQTVLTGQTATFSITASGSAPLSYQWQKNGTAISGATLASYTTPATISSDNGAQFTVIVSNPVGTVTSRAATLTINVPPSITTQPASQTVAAGQTATFSISASGTAPLSYQWQKNGTVISGAMSSTYTTPAETGADTGAQFTVMVSNPAGNVTSNPATLTVNSAARGALTPSTTSVNFNSVNLSSNSVLSVNFTNSGGSNITISSTTISGAGFTASGLSNGQIVGPGQVVTVNVNFAPAASGSVTGSFVVTSNASNSPVSISLSGTGVQPTVTSITVTPANPNIAVGAQLQFKAIDNLGNDITSSVVWATSDTSIATIAAGGLATAIANGTVTITATN